MPSISKQVARGVFLVLGTLFPTYLLFGPIAAWHHTYIWGILRPMVLEEEFRVPGRLTWGDADVILFPGRIVASAVLWLLCMVGVLILFKGIRGRNGTSKP